MKKIIIYILLAFSLNLFSDETNDTKTIKETSLSFHEAQMKHERENPAFMQKAGMMRVGEHAFYLRTNDEWTGFSTFFLGYRYAVNEYFNFGVEGGVSAIPHVYLAAIHLHFKIFESKNKFFFVGLRTRLGYRYQDSDFSGGIWPSIVGDNYLTLRRNGIYFAPDFTAAFRFGKKYRRHALYYSIYPRIDIDFVDKYNPVYFLFSPIMLGYEVRFPKKNFRWSFAIEGGYTFPIPWNGVPAGKWVNFPSLANISFNYRFGDKFYSKENVNKYDKE